jgi:HD domain
MLHTEIAALDEVLEAHAGELGRDSTAYRNHTYRVVNLCAALSPGEPEPLEKIAVAAAFHDLGIWTAGTFDYLEPSVRAAAAHLARAGRAEWTPEVTAAIRDHHKITAYRGPHRLVEPFRRADWVDVTRGLRRFGLPRSVLREVFAAWPDAGFHRRLLQLGLRRLRTHPLNPLPMVRL